MKIAIIGAGAAGCFCSIELKRRLPGAEVTVYEAGPKALAKVALTGGGRCNLTNSFERISKLSEAYPRGENLMKRALRNFSSRDCMEWFEREGVRLVTQEDCCVFPKSQDAMQIVGTLLQRMKEAGVVLKTGCRISNLKELDADIKIVTTGGSPKRSGLSFLDGYGLDISEPVPSLFTFNISDEKLRRLTGTVIQDVTAGICGTTFRANGPLLITDWGVSGPAILKLSSYAARYLAGRNYNADLNINWGCTFNAPDSRKQVSGLHPEKLTTRLWEHIIDRSGIRQDITVGELGSKSLNKLNGTLSSDVYHISGKGRFKEEFVTCGGVSLSSININTLESKDYPGLYFAGEVLDVDGITGGFNLQAAWSMAFTVAQSVCRG